MAEISKVAMNIAKEATGQSQGKIMQSIAPSTGDIQLTMAGEPGHELTPEQVLQLLEMTRIALSQLHKKQFLLAQEEPPKTMVHAIADQRGLQMNAVAENFAEYIAVAFLGELVILLPRFNLEAELMDYEQERIPKALKAIQNNYHDKKFNLGRLAELIDKNNRTAERTLQKRLNIEFVHALKAVRMTKAIPELWEEKSVVSVSEASGFKNPSYFNRCFRETYGLTPYRFQGKAFIPKKKGLSPSSYEMEKPSPEQWQASANELESRIQGIRFILFGDHQIDLLGKFVISPLITTSNIDTISWVIDMIQQNFNKPNFSSAYITALLNIQDWVLHVRMQNMRLNFEALLFAMRMQEASKILQSGGDASNILSMIGYKNAKNLRTDYKEYSSVLFDRRRKAGEEMHKIMGLFIREVIGEKHGS